MPVCFLLSSAAVLSDRWQGLLLWNSFFQGLGGWFLNAAVSTQLNSFVALDR